MNAWFVDHPGGSHAIARKASGDEEAKPLTLNDAVHHFRTTLGGSRWKAARGFHVFRHSFASNAAAAGIDQRVIDEWMGYQTEEMRRRYRHLFPEQRTSAVSLLFG